MRKDILIIVALFVVALVALGAVIFIPNNNAVAITNFDECAAAGYPIMESYPEQCRTPDGRIFVRVMNSPEQSFDSVIVLSMSETVKFSDGLSVTLVEINDSRCKTGVVCIWAGELSPKFSIVGGNIGESAREFNLGTATANNVVIRGYTFTLHDATETTATITVAKQGEQASCYIGGCSGQICSEREGVASTCEYKEEYACYKAATCERQSNGQCGWTQTPELQACLVTQ